MCRNPRAVDPSGEDLLEISKVSEIFEVSFVWQGKAAAEWSVFVETGQIDGKNEGKSSRNGHRWCLAWFTMQHRPFHVGMILFNSPWRPGRVSDDLYTLFSTRRFDFS